MKKYKFISILRISCTILLLCLAVYIVNPLQILYFFTKVTFQSILFAFILILLSFISVSIRWYYLVRQQSDNTPFVATIKTALWGIFLNSFIPGNLGNDYYRFRGATDVGSGKITVVSLLVQERLISLGVFLFCYLLGFAFVDSSIQATWEPLIIFFWSVFVLAVLAALYFWGEGLCTVITGHCKSATLKNICAAMIAAKLPLGSRDGRLVLLLTFSAFFFFAASLYVLSAGMRSAAGFSVICMGAVVVEIARFIPLTVQGIGIREGVMAWFFSLSGLPSGVGFSVAALGYALLALGQICAGGLSFLLPPHRFITTNANEKKNAD